MDFYELDAWKSSHKLTKYIYILTKKFPVEEKYSLTDQLRRAASSVGANIAEGYGRYHYADRNKFYYNSRGSIKEVQNFMLLSKDLGYITLEEFKEFWDLSVHSERLINGLIRSINARKQ